MSIFEQLFKEFPRARIQICNTDSGIWTQVNIPGLPSMQFTTESPKKLIRADETEYADFNKEPLAVLTAILALAKVDREADLIHE